MRGSFQICVKYDFYFLFPLLFVPFWSRDYLTESTVTVK